MIGSGDHIHRKQEPVVDGPEPCTVRVHVFAAPLLEMGLENILAGTRFFIAHAGTRGISDRPLPENPSTELFIVDEKYRPNEVLELIAELKARNAAARVIVLADHFDFNDIVLARQAGADGFCLTTCSRAVLIHSMELVLLGEIVVPSDLVLAIIEGCERGGDCARMPEFESYNRAPPKRPLSSREIEVLSFLKEGASNKVIARKLNLSEATVKVHVKTILRKISVGNRSQAALWAAYNLPPETAAQSKATADG